MNIQTYWPRLWGLTSAILVLFTLSSCQKAYYGTMEKLGVHKRDIMVERVEKARDSQAEVKEQFKSALDEFSSVLNFTGGTLQEKYNKLQDEYDQCEKKADNVRNRISKVEDVSEALFVEWEKELEQYSSATLRRDSEKKLSKTKQQYKQLITAMRRAEKKIAPVLTAFKDQVLYLKHNLNAQAIASLQSQLIAVEDDIAALVKDMETSIREADSFISTMMN